MYVIIYKPEGAVVSDELFDRCWELFPHGSGYAVWDNGRRVHEKGFMEKEEFYEAVKEFIHSENTRVVLHFRFATEDAEGKRNILPEFTHPFEIQLQDTKALLFVNGRFSESYKGIVGAPKVKKLVEDINQLKLKRWQYEKLLAEDGLLEGLFRYRGERARLLTLFEEDKQPFFSPKPPKGWIEYDGLLLSRKVSL
ncbi:MAG: hypothetical protein ACO2PP_14030 [Thermocrinis sp.]|uniref:hypothetical protein n=1 Tax=Thermocrinis sp. TaxID=2024383 RepID=UPI003C10DB1F